MEQIDFPLEELAVTAQQVIKNGGKVYLKWTCEACGERCCMDEANVFYSKGRHEDCKVEVGYVTDLHVKGGNYLVVQEM